MKFTLRQLLLLPLVFLLNTWLVAFFTAPVLVSYAWEPEASRVRRSDERVKEALRHCKYANIKVTDTTINNWLANRLPSDHPAAGILMDPPRQDVWGNPHRIQSRSSLDETPRHYSTGEDGVSTSEGNDPDDVRSWDEHPCLWYSRRQGTRRLVFCVSISALITMGGFWLLTHDLNPASVAKNTPE